MCGSESKEGFDVFFEFGFALRSGKTEVADLLTVFEEEDRRD